MGIVGVEQRGSATVLIRPTLTSWMVQRPKAAVSGRRKGTSCGTSCGTFWTELFK